MEITDRELLLGIFALLGSLAEKLTGQRPTVKLTDADKTQLVGICPGMNSVVTWSCVAELPKPNADTVPVSP